MNGGGPGRLHRARPALSAVFAVHGAVTGDFATRIPWIRDHLGLDNGQLGLALAFPALGSFAAMPLAGRITHRLGSRTALRLLIVLWCASLALPALAPSLPALCGALALYGAASGMADVAMNALGVETENLLGRPVMSGLHGMWSAGALAGAAVGTLAAHTGLDARLHLAPAAGVLALLGAAACRWAPDLRPPPGERPPPRFALPPRSALAIGAVGFCAVFAEGAGLDWSAVYLRDVMGSGAGPAAACTTAFSCTMAAARFAGDAAVRRFGPVRTVRASGALATAGGLLVVAAPGPAPAMAGFALLGLGVAVVVPLAFASAARSGPAPSQAIAGVATITYSSSLVAPSVIGRLSDATSLTASFGLVTALTVGLTAAAGVLRVPAGRPAGRPGALAAPED
ncbi:MFS transporter [Streptomyces orinoci]|uniref:MFS transporter n=1 Tax=Streptomyces orinoci TaxID=67339 RepID=A0ABV3K544_STRON|nr:MFS transporter [Streptomyces orinoci]